MAAPNPNHRLLQKVQILHKFRSLLQDRIDTRPILLTESRRLAHVDSENRIGQVQVTRMYNLGIEKKYVSDFVCGVSKCRLTNI